MTDAAGWAAVAGKLCLQCLRNPATHVYDDYGYVLLCCQCHGANIFSPEQAAKYHRQALESRWQGAGPHGPAHKLEEVVPLSFWCHYKGGYYLALGTASESTNGPLEGRELVVYWSLKYKALRARELNQFLDGRFQPADGPRPPP